MDVVKQQPAGHLRSGPWPTAMATRHRAGWLWARTAIGVVSVLVGGAASGSALGDAEASDLPSSESLQITLLALDLVEERAVLRCGRQAPEVFRLGEEIPCLAASIARLLPNRVEVRFAATAAIGAPRAWIFLRRPKERLSRVQPIGPHPPRPPVVHRPQRALEAPTDAGTMTATEGNIGREAGSPSADATEPESDGGVPER